MEQLAFQVDGEFITDLVRSWFWDEHKDYSICEDLLLNCLINDSLSEADKKNIVLSIIEGRKKLVGINEFDLIEDGENIRPIIQMVDFLKKENTINKIKEDIIINPMMYVDEYSTLISYRAAKEKHIAAYNDVISWFSDETHSGRKRDIYYDSETRMGLWLFYNPELIYNILKEPITPRNRETFFEKLYDYIGDINLSKDMKTRQERYRIWKKHTSEANKIRTKEEIELDLKEKTEIITNLYHSNKPIDINSMTKKEYATYIRIEQYHAVGNGLEPDDMLDFTGLIDKNGNFYSCSFGAHNIKAYYLILMHFDEFGYDSREDARLKLDIERALDKIIESGWIAIRYLPSMGNYLGIDELYRPTKAQIDKVWETMLKYDISYISGLEEAM